MRILMIVTPYLLNTDQSAQVPSKAMLPVGLLSIASGLRELGHKLDVCDLVFTSAWQRKLSQTLNAEFDLFLVCCHTARNIAVVKLIVEQIRNKQNNAKIVLGGNLCATFGCQEFEQLGIDVNAVVRGYGHGVLSEILEANGDIQPNEVPASLPIPALDLLDKRTRRRYLEASGGQYPIVGPGGFGCKFRCKYCQAHQNTPQFLRDLDNIAEEIKMAKRFGYQHFWCVDNCCLTDWKTAFEFDLLVNNIGLTWSGMTRFEDIIKSSEVDLQALKALAELAIGVESVSRQALRKWRRNSNLELVRKALDLILATDHVKATAFVIIDAPETTEQDFWALRKFLGSTDRLSISWAFCNPSPHDLLDGKRKPNEYGFYHWPFGLSKVSPERIVQHAMILSGENWCGWQLDEGQPYYETAEEFGVNFIGWRLTQAKTARAATGNLWEAWQEEERP